MTKNELKEIIKECINEETSMDEAWTDTFRHLGKQALGAVQQKAQQAASAAQQKAQKAITAGTQKVQQAASAVQQQYKAAQQAGTKDELNRIQSNIKNDLIASIKKSRNLAQKAGMKKLDISNLYINELNKIIKLIQSRKI